MTVNDFTSPRGTIQDTNATAMMTTGMMVTNMMASVMVLMMMLMLTVNISGTIVARTGTRAGIGSPLAATIGVIE